VSRFNQVSHGATRLPRALAIGDVHLWLANLDDVNVYDALEVLSTDERDRAARLHSRQDRDRFIAARALLRNLLAVYVGLIARDLIFAYGPHGKPQLAANPKDVRFNLSHSAERVIYAFTVGREIGVDLERSDSVAEAASIAELFFSPVEASKVSHAPESQREQTFLSYWTCKEALAKASGKGMSRSMNDPEINFDETGQPQVTNTSTASPWSLRTIPINPHFTAALAVAGPDPIRGVFRLEWNREG